MSSKITQDFPKQASHKCDGGIGGTGQAGTGGVRVVTACQQPQQQRPCYCPKRAAQAQMQRCDL